MITTRLTLLLSLASLSGLALTLPTTAAADDRPGAFRLALGTDLVGYRHVDWVEQTAFGTYGRGFVTRVRELRVGVVQPRIGLELSGVVAPLVLIGVTAAVQYLDPALSEEYVHETWETVEWTAVPWVEIALLPREIVRPFLRGGIGIAGSYAAWTGELTDDEELVTQLRISAVLGAHIFLGREVSLDPYVSAAYASGVEVRTDNPAIRGRVEGGIETIDLAFGLALSAWLGP